MKIHWLSLYDGSSFSFVLARQALFRSYQRPVPVIIRETERTIQDAVDIDARVLFPTSATSLMPEAAQTHYVAHDVADVTRHCCGGGDIRIRLCLTLAEAVSDKSTSTHVHYLLVRTY